MTRSQRFHMPMSTLRLAVIWNNIAVVGGFLRPANVRAKAAHAMQYLQVLRPQESLQLYAALPEVVDSGDHVGREGVELQEGPHCFCCLLEGNGLFSPYAPGLVWPRGCREPAQETP